jgi:hypothetical protein
MPVGAGTQVGRRTRAATRGVGSWPRRRQHEVSASIVATGRNKDEEVSWVVEGISQLGFIELSGNG